MPIMLMLHTAAHIRFQTRNSGTRIAKFRKTAFLYSLKKLPIYLLYRFQRKPYPLGASFRIAKSLSWSIQEVKMRPLKVLRYVN